MDLIHCARARGRTGYDGRRCAQLLAATRYRPTVHTVSRFVVGLVATTALGCGAGDPGRSTAGAPGLGDTGQTDGGTPTSGTGGPSLVTSTDDGGPGEGDDTGTGDVPTDMLCSFAATDFGEPLQELDVPLGSSEVLTFEIQGVPDASTLSSAVLHFDSYDADHPGEEGVVWVNGAGPFDLPADAGWDNQPGQGSIDVTSAIVTGTNTIEFGAGTFVDGSFFRIGNVRVDVEALVTECPAPPPGVAVERTVHFTDATYTERHNWVLRCEGAFEYAYTARGDEHIPTDKEGLYAPDGNRTGTATFSFPGVVAATYEVQIRSRHTVNRNPLGALVVVDGAAERIPQNDDLDFVTDVWGEATLEGDVDVVLDSTMEGESDSVVWVRLVPVP